MALDTIGSMMLRGQAGQAGIAGQTGRFGSADGPRLEEAARPDLALPAPPTAAGDAVPGVDFGSALERALGNVAAAQGTADTKTVQFLTGQDMPIHEVMIAVTEAELAVQMTTAIAAKAIAAYQEIWRMDV